MERHCAIEGAEVVSVVWYKKLIAIKAFAEDRWCSSLHTDPS